MLRWRKLLIAAFLTAAACGQDESPPEAPSMLPDAGASPAADAAAVPLLPAAPEAGTLVAQPIDSGARPVDAGGVANDAGQADAAPPTSALTTGNPCGSGPEPLAANIKLREVALYQTVKVPLFKDNAWLTPTGRNASIVQGKKGLLRAFVEPQPGFTPHVVRAVLTIENNASAMALVAERNVVRASSDDASDSTFDFKLDGALIGDSTKLSISLLETTCIQGAGSSGARLPATGTQALSAEAIGKLHVVLVPVTLAGRTPDTSDAQLSKVRDALRAYYPVADAEVSFHAPITYSGTVQSSGTGWAELLSQIGRERQRDGVAANVYYFGLITPAATFKDYCRTGCVLGLAPQTTVVSRPNQVGLGVGFVDENTYATVVHELGHAHGLPHAPCVPRGGSIDGADAKFPYAGAKIGSWGWDSRSDKLMSPSSYADVMSYCEPVWISDYNYQKLATRSKSVNSAAYVYSNDKGAPRRWRGLIMRADGSARWSGLTLDELPGETSAARALDAQGTTEEIEVVRVPLSHTTDSFVYVPEVDATWIAVDLGDHVLELADIEPAP